MQATFDSFASHLRERDRAERTIQGYLDDLRAFVRWHEQTNGETFLPERLTPTDVREYRQWLLSRQAAPASVNRKLAALRAYVHWLRGETLDVRGLESQKLAPRWLDRREQFALLRESERALNAASTSAAKTQALRDRAILLLLLHSGLRISELCALRLGDVELTERKGKVIVRAGKGTKRREIPLNQPARQALRAWLEVRPEAGEALFLGKRGDALTPAGVHRRLADLARRAGVEGLSPHTLRHTFAKNLVDAGVGLERVAALLGHASLNTTRIYVAPGKRDLEQAVERLE
ncbi:MAG: tyrosine-type recombinase/integrase [Chloroflexota bacterium]|jgi:site-specific recombinase XerD